jgi:hypothetical protein
MIYTLYTAVMGQLKNLFIHYKPETTALGAFAD